MICSSAFWKQKCENLKNISLTFFNPYRATLSLARGTNRQFYYTGMVIYNKLDNYFVVSADRQTFLGFEMTANLRDTSPLNNVFSAVFGTVVLKHFCCTFLLVCFGFFFS